MKYTISIIVFLNTLILFGQTPSNDPHWQLVWEDNFNTINTNIWKVANHFDHYGGEPQVYTNRPDNVFINNGTLVLRVKKETYSCPQSAVNSSGCARQNNSGLPYEYTSGWIESKQAYNIQYGYIESRIKLPYGYGFWTAFWTFVGSGVVNNSNAAEIDIFEMLGHLPVNTTTTNIHREYCDINQPDYPVCANIPSYYQAFTPTNFNYTSWHTYGIEWSPTQIVWYIDNVSIRTLNNHGITDPVRIILNLAIEPWSLPNTSTPFPSDMIIDYVKVYDLNTDCKTDMIVCNYNFSNHDNRVKRKIIIGNGSCINSLNPGDNVFLRAKEGVVINGNFTVPLGAQLTIYPSNCY